MNDRSPQDLERRAARRVKLKLGWWTHALVFTLVNAGLWLSMQFGLFGGSHAGARWVPIWGWALGLAIHGVVTLVKLHGQGLAERMLQAEVERLRSR